MPPARPIVILVAMALALGAAGASCDEEPSGVTVGAAALGAVSEVVDASATVTAKSAATVTAAAEGTLTEVRVRPGQQVRSGQVLAVISSDEAEDRLRQAERAVDAASAAGSGGYSGTGGLSAAQRATDRAAEKAFTDAQKAAGKVTDEHVRQALLRQVTVAQRQYDAASELAARTTRAVQRGVASLGSAISALSSAQRLQAQQAYDLAKSTVDALTLRAPIDGVVQLGGAAAPGSDAGLTDLLGQAAAGAGGVSSADVLGDAAGSLAGVDTSVPVGGQVGAGTPVFTVVDVSELGLTAEVDETDVLLVTVGAPASVELDAAIGANYAGEVRSIDVLPTPSSRGGVSYRVRLSLDGGEFADGRAAPLPRPGMSAVAHLRVREATDTVTVPAAAVFSAEGGDAVWAVRNGRAEQATVTVGVQGQDMVEVVSGIEAGQPLVVGGTDQVRAGQQVP